MSDAMTMTTRFWSKVEKKDGDGCWEWTASKQKGYGRIKVGSEVVRAHRYSWELHFGAIPDGLQVCHHCDNPSCVRPDHLFVGTAKDNSQDAKKKGRLRVDQLLPGGWNYDDTCKRGHDKSALGGAYFRPDGHRECRFCSLDKRKKQLERLRETRRKPMEEIETNFETHGEIAVIDRTGDTKTIWDRHNEDEVEAARETFRNLRAKGYLAYKVDKKGEKGEQIHAFDRDAERIILSPPLVGG